MTAQTVTVGNHRLELKHLDKVFFPNAGLTKGDVVDYYRRISPVMVPHLQQRPLNLLRAPQTDYRENPSTSRRWPTISPTG